MVVDFGLTQISEKRERERVRERKGLSSRSLPVVLGTKHGSSFII